MKVCFVAHGVYPILTRSCPVERIGGAELQQVQIGRVMSRNGFDVSYVVFDHGQQEPERVDGMTIYNSFKESEGIPGIRFLYPRLYKIWKALRRADADVYYCRAAGFLPAVLAMFCRIHGKKFVFAAAHDTDFIPGKHLIPTLRDKLLYRYGIRHAAKIIVQSKQQQKLLMDNMQLQGTVIRNLLDGEVVTNSVSEQRIILWVATIRNWKRPLQFVQLARAFPNEHFVMIGGRDGSEPALYQSVTEQCSQLPNIEFLGFQQPEQTERYVAQSKVFVNTSVHEGFPNTFLQAWRRGVPVISYVDPDGVVAANGLGTIVTNENELAEVLRNFLAGARHDPEVIKKYFHENHSSGVIDHYRNLFKSI